ncbi:MAG TPA: heavy-metal-associated domain-containing protein [Pyrinomonadaceae bacterium]|nr:heavy-metal-associated domain-containing protein [Pyrinomonadaceae bacterium]HEU4874372.1 heavy-metal-associated domain-containing protein [Pyrinomonadaceae bacterium]
MRSRITNLVVSSVLVLTLGVITAAAFTKTVTIRVDGMKCAKCSGAVTKALKATEGVEDAQVNHEKGEAVIKYDDQKLTEAKLREVINGTGFKVAEEKGQ